MPRGDGTGSDGTLVNCIDPETGIRRPMRFNMPFVGRLGLANRRGRGGRRGR